MKPVNDIPADTARHQSIASDPGNSAWVSAHAGSGKTHVLAQRVIRLLLDGTDPAKILCLTYTRAAAANMSNRIFGRLAGWTRLDDGALTLALVRLEGRTPSKHRLTAARRLFAQALETPGGLKIQTIHAFCEAVLHQFPIEANIAGHFELLDGPQEAALTAEAKRDMISGAADGSDSALARAFAIVIETGHESGLQALLGEVVRQRDGLRAFIDQISDGSSDFTALGEAFGFQAGESAATAAASIWPLPGFSSRQFEELYRAAEETGAKTVLNNILPGLEEAFAATDPETRLQFLAKALLKTDGQPYDAKAFKRDLRVRLPNLPDSYAAAAAAVLRCSDRAALCRLLEATRAALTIADRLIGRYERLKSARGFLDFNDLITRTVRLLSRQDASAWVHYKLDRGIDHILVDEAQDTSPGQWSVVRGLAEDFFSGFGARENVRRTVFAVGDEKQSIYSFQGAAPEAFSATGYEFRGKVKGIGRKFEMVRLQRSFRSTGDVLAAVDRVFSREHVRRGLTRDAEPIKHEAIRAGAPGLVELWPSVGATVVAEPEDWRAPIDRASAPAVRLAEEIARTLKNWLTDGEALGGQGRRVRAGDILVLVRKRDGFVHAISRELKNRGVPVAGADRLRLQDHIAVMDLMALGRFVLQPQDDLSLAALLKSPVFGMTEECLFDLAAGRPDGWSLYRSLRASAKDDANLAPVAGQLQAWRSEADYRPVFEFYAAILGRDGVRRRMVARLGHEAGEILDEFLNFALASEQTGLPGLEAFLATLQTAGPEIRREMDQTRDEVRIMTVHAAKGLEAPVVFLVDGGSAPFSSQHQPRLVPFRPPNRDWTGDGFFWRAGAAFSNSVLDAACAEVKEKAEEEYRRLLYVGMTRAEDRLIVCGHHGKRPPSDMTWHAIVRAALADADCEEAPFALGPEPLLRFRVTKAGGAPADEAEEPRQDAFGAMPEELRTPLPPADALPQPLSPSGASALLIDEAAAAAKGSPVLRPDPGPSLAVERGVVLHRLLQMLPDLAPGERRAAAHRYIGRAARGWTEAEREEAWVAIAAILGDAQFAPLFLPGSRAEVAVMGTVTVRGRERAVSGKIDRLAVTADEAMIVDYKTNRLVPEQPAQLPAPYILQLALYRSMIAPLYPGREVRAALLFTQGPALRPVPPELMDAALARLTAA